MALSVWQSVARAVLLAAAGTIAALALAMPAAAQEAVQAVDAAMQACRANQFDAFFRLYVQSPEVRERFSAEYLNTVPAGVRSDFISKVEYLARFPLRVQGWQYLTPSLAGEHGEDFVLLRTRRVTQTGWRVDWVNARFDVKTEDGHWVGVPLELHGVPKQLTFTASDDGCWRASSLVWVVKDTPFELGVQRLHCAVQANDYRQELTRMVDALADQHGLEVARELATCVTLLDRIDAAIRRDATLATLRRQIDQSLAALARRQPPAARKALAQDEQRFRRSLLREQYILAEGPKGETELRDELAGRLASRLAQLGRIETARKDVVGEWRNVAGGITIRRQGAGAVEVDASLADPEFLAWTCEFNETMQRARTALSFSDTRRNTVRLALRDGLLYVEQGNASDYCGANGTLSGVYFPQRPAPKTQATLDDAPSL